MGVAARVPSYAAVCGALGAFDPGRVRAMAERFERRPAIVHEDERSVLALDREPIRWAAGESSGLAWEEQPGAGRAGARSLDEAAAGACGLVVAGGDRAVHSSASGIGCVYFHAAPGAAYFASSVDALAATAPEPLSVDWEAWASILTIGYPIGDRTPFTEIRRLGPSSALRVSGGHAAVESRRWPWAEIEPVLGVEEGAGDVLAGMRSAVARLGDRAICELSGGQDSRLCLALLVERGDDVLALTGDEDLGHDREQRVAARVAAAAGVDHEVVTPAPERYWEDLTILAGRVDYAFVRAPWRIPMLPVMRSSPGIVVDGFGFDTLAGPGDRFFTPEAVDPDGGDGVVRALWSALERGRARPGSRGMVPELADALWASTEAQLIASSAPLRGHPSRAPLTFYLARQVRGVSLGSTRVLGADVPVAVPLIDGAVARAALAISFQAKQGHRLYDAVWAGLGSPLGTLPTTTRGDAEEGAPRQRRSQSPEVAEAFAACLGEGPLTPYLEPAKLRALDRHRRGRPARVPAALLGPAYFHLWHRRYGDRLRTVDPRDALG